MEDMSYQEEKEEIRKILEQYAQVLNTADAALIPEFYAEDALFVPDGRNTLYTKEAISGLGSTFLITSGFSINYSIKDTTIDGTYAFVEALAAVTFSAGHQKGDRKNKYSIDLFTFKKVAGSWKIYRYIFNNVKGSN